MKLPKLYRKVWLKIEWLKDECINGEHEQTDGHIYIESRRVKNPDNSWFWKIDPLDIENNRWELEMAGYFCEYDEFYYELEYKNPYPWNEGDWCYAYQRPTIKQQVTQQDLIKELDDCPF